MIYAIIKNNNILQRFTIWNTIIDAFASPNIEKTEMSSKTWSHLEFTFVPSFLQQLYITSMGLHRFSSASPVLGSVHLYRYSGGFLPSAVVYQTKLQVCSMTVSMFHDTFD